MSKRIRVIWYKAAWDKHWLDNAISIWTGLISAKNRKVGPYSHVEIWTPDDCGDFTCCDNEDECVICTHDINNRMFYGTCWTSTTRGKNNGTVSRPANKVINNPARWDYCEIEITDEQYDRMLVWMNIEISFNLGYSKRDLLKFFGLGFFFDDKRNICSEFCGNAINQAFGHDKDEVVSPRRLAWKLTKAGYQIKPLK